MAQLHVISGAHESMTDPVVRKIGFDDLKIAGLKGIEDFWAMPTHVIFLSVIYPLVGFFLVRLTFGYNILPLLFPLVAGYALIGPFAAVALYEMSRQRETNPDVTWKDAFAVLKCPSLDAIAALGALLMALFVIWLAAAQWIYYSLFGFAQPESLGQFLYDILTTQRGWALIIVGHAVGFLFAALVLIIGVVSFPLLLDRDVGALVAMRTSMRAVMLNPVMMAVWGFCVAAALVLGSLPFFVGLAVVMPILAHASWHLYRRVVER
jgi:uncharacterized membrane protein